MTLKQKCHFDEISILTTSGATSVENFIKMTTSQIQYLCMLANYANWIVIHFQWISSNLKRVEPASTGHYNDVIMRKMASQITSLSIVYSNVYLSADLRKHQSSAPLVFVREIHRGPVNSPHKGPVTRKMFPFDDAIMKFQQDSQFQYVSMCRHTDNERRRYICNVFSHWLRACFTIDRKQVFCPPTLKHMGLVINRNSLPTCGPFY